MSAIRGTIRGGQVVFDTPPDWPDGTAVTVDVVGSEYVGIGMREEDWPTEPEGIAALLDRIDKIEPFLTPEEQAAWEERRASDKAAELARWEEGQKRIEGLFE